MERVNDFEYNEKRSKAYINVKVGNVVGELTLYANYKDEVSLTVPPNIQNVIDAGMELDFSDIKEDFLELHLEKKAEQKRKERKKAAEKYDESWVHNVDEIEGVEYDIESKEEYLDGERYSRHPHFRVKYKGHTVSITKENVGRSYSRNIKYNISHSLTDYNRRNYAAPENAVEKIVELADEHEEREQRKKERKERKKQERAEKKERLEREFGEIEIEKKYKHRRHGDGYYYYEFYIVRGDDKYGVREDTRGDETTYNLRGFKDLSAKQVKDILNVVTG